MGELSIEKREEIKQLVTAQKKAKINWVATICQVSETDLLENIAEIGLMIEGEFILIPSETKEQKVEELLKAKREQIIADVINRRYYCYDPTNNFATKIASEVVSGLLISSGIKPSHFESGMNPSLYTKITHQIEHLKYVIFPFNGTVIETSAPQARKILDQMKNELLYLPDEQLRLHIPIKKYIDFLILPQLKGKIDSYEEQMLLTTAQNEDVNIFNAANNHFSSNIIDQKTKGNYPKEITFRLPTNEICKVKANQLVQFQNQMLEIYSFEFRKIFYERDSLIQRITRGHL